MFFIGVCVGIGVGICKSIGIFISVAFASGFAFVVFTGSFRFAFETIFVFFLEVIFAFAFSLDFGIFIPGISCSAAIDALTPRAKIAAVINRRFLKRVFISSPPPLPYPKLQ